MDRMPRIRFTLEVDCDIDEPDQFLLVYDGEILEFEDDSDQDVKIGEVRCFFTRRLLFPYPITSVRPSTGQNSETWKILHL
jgi:hypothetical protein